MQFVPLFVCLLTLQDHHPLHHLLSFLQVPFIVPLVSPHLDLPNIIFCLILQSYLLGIIKGDTQTKLDLRFHVCFEFLFVPSFICFMFIKQTLYILLQKYHALNSSRHQYLMHLSPWTCVLVLRIMFCINKLSYSQSMCFEEYGSMFINLSIVVYIRLASC